MHWWDRYRSWLRKSDRWSATAGAAFALSSLTAAGCGGSGDGVVALSVQGLFQAEIPAGWQLSIPQNFETDGPPPVLAAGPKGGDSGLAVFVPTATDAAGALAEMSPRIDANLSEPATETSEGQQRVRATGTYVDRNGKEFKVVAAGVQPNGASRSVVVFCQLSDLTLGDCDRFIRSLMAP